jgi:hypothetical protein
LIVFDDELPAVDVSGDDPGLATLFCHQLHNFNHPLPSQMTISETNDLVLCVMSWAPSPGFGLPGVAADALSELTEAHLHRKVGEVTMSDTPGFDGAVVYLFLDGVTEAPGERAAAMGAWAEQGRRTAVNRQRLAATRGAEARRLRARSRLARGEARRQRARHRAAGD